jgi:hypothetical protein
MNLNNEQWGKPMSTYQDGNKPKNPVRYGKAVQIMERLLRGEGPKEVAYLEDVSLRSVHSVKDMFPLFFKKRNSRATRVPDDSNNA